MASQSTSVARAVAERQRLAARRSWWADALEAAVWFAAAIGVAFMLNARGLLTVSPVDYIYTLGRALGIVAAVLMLAQVLLASRAPWIERVIGQDKAIVKHSRLGKWAISLMLGHFAIITGMTAHYNGTPLLQTALDWPKLGWFMAMVEVSIALFAAVFVMSFAAVRGLVKYETWHAVHLVVYVAVAFAVPHQFLKGTTFKSGGPATWFWALLYVVAFGSFVAYRIVRPLWITAEYAPRVDAVRGHPDGSVSIYVSGDGLERLRAASGQFFLWRFLQPGLWWQAHPYSLSVAAGGLLRLTVKPVGDGSSSLRALQPGTRVLLEGPFGTFTRRARRGHQMLLIGAGIGVTPIRSILGDASPSDPITVVVRARSLEEAPLLDEITELARLRQAKLKVLVGPRGTTWGTADERVSVASFLTDPATADVYICGPRDWALAVEADALAAGVHADSIHREEFTW